MRIVAWNCCDGFERKFGHLERLRPDIAIICEVRPSCLQSSGLTDQSVWTGDVGAKGLAVVCYGNWKVVERGPAIAEKWFLPLVLSNGMQTINVVGAWLDTRAPCEPPTMRALDGLEEFLGSRPSILAGDFNQSVSWDATRSRSRHFRPVLDKLSEMKMASAWHSHTSEKHGEESSATLHWRWQETSRFHIDFIFASVQALAIENVSIGSYGQYVANKISDHLPLTADFRFV